jgi:putative salt-induced outer membrane protein YdiY
MSLVKALLRLSLFFLMSTVIVATIHGGEILFTNGDHLSGELVKIEARKLYWQTEVGGELVVPLENLADISTTALIQTDELPGPCVITGANNGSFAYLCDDGASGIMTLSEFDYVEPYGESIPAASVFRGKLFAVGRQSTGNSEQRSWAANQESSYRRGEHRHQTEVDFDTLEKGTEEAEATLSARYTYDWFVNQRWYWHNNIQGGFDEAAAVDQRYHLGTGVGFQVWDRDDRALSLESSITYVSEQFSVPPGATAEFESEATFAAWQWGLNYRHALTKDAEFFHKQQFVQSLEASADWSLETETGLTVPVVGGIYGEIRVDYDVDNTPVENARREDAKFSVGFGYTW